MIRVELTREQSKIVPLFIRNNCIENPLADMTGLSSGFDPLGVISTF